MMSNISFVAEENNQRLHFLVDLLRKRDVVFFAGAALSRSASLPLAFEIKSSVLQELSSLIIGELKSPISHHDLQWLATNADKKIQQKWNALPLEILFQFVTNILGEYGFRALTPLNTEPANVPYHHNHWFLASAAEVYYDTIFTTNFDHLIEDAFRDLKKDVAICALEKDMQLVAENRQPREVVLAKLHGSIDRLESIVVTVDQAGEVLPSGKRSVFANSLESHHICYVGYGLGDFDLYSTIHGLDNFKQPFVLLRPLYPGEQLDDFMEANQRVLELVRRCDGIPIVYDINDFFDRLCSEVFPAIHSQHGDSWLWDKRRESHIDFPVAAHIWAQKIRPLDALKILGALYHHLGEGERSKQVYEKALSLALASSQKEILELQLEMARAYVRVGQYEAGAKLCDQILHKAGRLGEHAIIANAWFLSGDALRIQKNGLSLKGLSRLLRAKRFYSELPDKSARHGEGSILLSLTLLLKQFVPEWSAFSQANEMILFQLKHAYGLLSGPNGNALRIIANMHRVLKQYHEAIEVANQAEIVCRWHSDDVGRANTYRVLGDIYTELSNIRRARFCYLQALGASRNCNDSPGIVKALVKLGRLAYLSDRPKRSLRLFLLAKESLKHFGSHNLSYEYRRSISVGIVKSWLWEALQQNK